ncbi:MAG: hypothetical protein Q9157_000964 [Trypethelium eluteriae]
MLNDVLSLCVGLWAVRVANQNTNSKKYTYGWQRAETLGALINGVFLVALCLSIFLEAIQRFIEPQEVSHPMFVLIVGCCGLASNVLGLFLFHEHSHGSGGHAHGHKHEAGKHGHTHNEEGNLTLAEQGLSEGLQETIENVADEGGNVADVLPESRIGNWPQTRRSPQKINNAPTKDVSTGHRRHTLADENTPLSPSSRANVSGSRRRSSGSRAYSSLREPSGYPASFRKEIISAGRLAEDSPESSNENTDEDAVTDDTIENDEAEGLLSRDKSNGSPHGGSGRPDEGFREGQKHAKHKPTSPSGGHSHGDLNMRGVFLHVLGDALGNLGVIASALFIWLSSFSWRFYSDPAISLIITVIILFSAIPLCQAASRILLQAVPEHVSIDAIQNDIKKIPGIVSCHHLHVWQLSDTTLIASVHVQIEFNSKGEGSKRYMRLVKAVKKCLHRYNIHNSTIQPEFCPYPEHDHEAGSAEEVSDSNDGQGTLDGTSKAKVGSKQASLAGSLCENANACFLDCDDDCGDGQKCCPGRGDADG